MLALTFVAGLALAAPAAADRPNVLLVTVDTLRPDALGWVAGRNQTPAIDALAREGFRFRAAVSPAPVTLPAHASIMTGLAPRRHGARDNGQPLPAAPATLAETLGAGGYATGAFVSGFPLARAFGVDRGFQSFDDTLPDGPPDRRERRAERTTAAAAAWIARAPEPWFAWVHYYDPHDPYEAPGAPGTGVRAAYDAEVAYVDGAFGRLRAAVGARRRGVVTLLTADHGESLGEHGERTHGFFLYESTIAVPLVVHFPGRVAAGESALPARLVDVAPTLLDLAGAAGLPDVDGVSLVPLVSGRSHSVPPATMETLRPWASYGWSPLAALRDGDWKLVDAPRPELYDVARDPGERTDRRAAEPSRAATMTAALARLRVRPAPSGPALAPEAAERLRALGYTGAGAAPPPDEPPPGLADPKDRLAEWNALSDAEALLEGGRHAEAVARFDALLATDPANRFALARSGQALVAMGRVAEGIVRLERAVAAGPGHAESRLALAQALLGAGRASAAADAYTELARLQPREPSHWVGLGNALGQARQQGSATAAFARAVALRPSDPDLVTRLAFAEYAAGRTSEAAAHLGEAAALAPGRFAHAGALGIMLARLGRPGARAWLAKSRAGEADHGEARFELARLDAPADPAAARRALREALAATPALRPRAEADPLLAPLLR
ncbi:MAG: sulfatase-like hydrolase/transferase [Vicinamibacteria bacterium]